jgi:hypothetical protein
MNLLDRVKNAGKFISQPIDKIATQLNRGFKNYPYSFRVMLEKHGNEVIQSIKIVRKPLQMANQILLNIVSLGQYSQRVRNSPYDSLFHLKLIVNDRFSLEKTTTASFTINNQTGKNAQTSDVSDIPQGLTIKQMCDNCFAVMQKDMFSYNAFRNNCQHFASKMLSSSGMTGYDSFILQDVVSIFKGLSTSRKIMTSTLDVANRGTMIFGTGLIEDWRGGEFKQLTTSSSSDIHMMLKKLGLRIAEDRIFMRNEVKEPLSEGNYIINMEATGQRGSHWCCFIKNKHQAIYYDPFGVFVPEDVFQVFKAAKLLVYYNEKQIQDISSTSCAYHCLAWLFFMSKKENGKTLLQRFKKWNKQFSYDDQKANEKILLEYFNKIYK